MKFIDFFAGIGGFRKGMELAGHDAGVSDSLARTYPLQESKPDFKETVQACFSELCTLSDSSKKKINPLTLTI